MVPKTGTTVQTNSSLTRQEYANAISRALKSEVGQSARAAKTVMRWTGASERAVKYWLAGSRAPSGAQLILLARNSDAVLQEFLHLCGRNLYEVSVELAAAEAALARATAMVRAIGERER